MGSEGAAPAAVPEPSAGRLVYRPTDGLTQKSCAPFPAPGAFASPLRPPMQLPLSWEPSPRPAAERRTGFAMRSAAVLALLLYTGQAIALPVNSLMNKGDAEVMKCIVEVISDTLSKPSPMPVSQECFETLRGDERILSILRHQNLLKELQELAFQGAKERAQQQKQPSSFEEELSEVLENQKEKAELKEATGEASSQDAVEKRGESVDKEELGAATEEAGPRVSPPPRLGSEMENDQGPREEEAANTHHPASLPGQEHPSPQVQGDTESPDREKGQGGGQGQQSVSEEEADEEAKAGERGVSQEEYPTSTLNPHPSLSYKETRRAPGRPETLAVEGREKTGAEPSKEKGRQESSSSEEMVGPPEHPVRGGKSGEPEQQGNSLSKEWEDAKRWSKMDQLAKQLTAKKRLVGEDMEDDPDRSMKLAFRARSYDFGGPGPQLRRGWRPSSQEDSVEAGLSLPSHSYPEEKKEEEGSANRRAEDQELESLSAIEVELEKVAHQLQALRQG